MANRKKVDFTNQKFGNLLVLRRDKPNNSGRTYWIVKCVCDKIISISQSNLVRKTDYKTKSCGCLRRGFKKFINLTNKKFGKVLVLGREKNITFPCKTRAVQWSCICDCGKKFTCIGKNLKTGTTTSCGCQRFVSTYKGIGDLSGGDWHQIQRSAKIRNIKFSISIEEAWELFLKQNKRCCITNIKLHMSKDNKSRIKTASLDRIDSYKGYISGNVQWTHKKINFMKQRMSQKQFINWCKLIAKNN